MFEWKKSNAKVSAKIDTATRKAMNAASAGNRHMLIADPQNAEAAAGVESGVEGKGLAPARDLPTFPVEPVAKHHPVLPENLSIDEVQKQLDSHYFHHGMDFGDGLITKSAADVTFVEQVASAFFHPINLAGKSMLDIGAWTGAYSFAAKRRGAQRVVASDHYVWTHPHFRARQAFDFALRLTGLDIEAKQIDLPDITSLSVGKFDVVLFSGVFYHLINAVHLTRQISACAEHLLILETHHDALDNPRPSMVFYPGTALQGDGSNWWGPNPHCIYELLLEFGFSDIWYCDGPRVPDRGIYHAFRNEESRKVMGWKPDGPWISLSDPANRAIIFAPTASGH